VNFDNTKRFFLPGGVALSVILADQLCKIWVRNNLPTAYDKISLIENHLDFIHRKNSGIAFSLFASVKSAPFIFALISLAAVGYIAYLIFKNKNLPKIVILALAAIAGGATGNFIDRIIPPHKVVDFIDFYFGNWHWPAFNIADSSICVGAALLVIASFIYRDPFSASQTSSRDDEKNIR